MKKSFTGRFSRKETTHASLPEKQFSKEEVAAIWSDTFGDIPFTDERYLFGLPLTYSQTDVDVLMQQGGMVYQLCQKMGMPWQFKATQDKFGGSVILISLSPKHLMYNQEEAEVLATEVQSLFTENTIDKENTRFDLISECARGKILVEECKEGFNVVILDPIVLPENLKEQEIPEELERFTSTRYRDLVTTQRNNNNSRNCVLQ